MKPKISEILLWLGIFFLAIVIGATVYQMMVIVPEFTRDLPNGMIEFANGRIQTKSFWASPIMPIGLVILIGALVSNWKTKRRKWLLIAIGLVILGEAMTSFLAYPQLKIMGIIGDNPSTDASLISATVKNWIIVDQIRFFLLAVPSFFLYLKALTIKV